MGAEGQLSGDAGLRDAAFNAAPGEGIFKSIVEGVVGDRRSFYGADDASVRIRCTEQNDVAYGQVFGSCRDGELFTHVAVGRGRKQAPMKMRLGGGVGLVGAEGSDRRSLGRYSWRKSRVPVQMGGAQLGPGCEGETEEVGEVERSIGGVVVQIQFRVAGRGVEVSRHGAIGDGDSLRLSGCEARRSRERNDREDAGRTTKTRARMRIHD